MVYGPFQTSLIPDCQYGAVHSSELLLLPDLAGCQPVLWKLQGQQQGLSHLNQDKLVPVVGTVAHPVGPLVSGGRRWMHTPVGNVPELPAPWVWSHAFTKEPFLCAFRGMDSLLLLMFQHPNAQHRLPAAPAGALHDWLLPALCHVHPVDA